MTLNPLTVVDQVIDEYRSYLETEFRARDEGLRDALRARLEEPGFLAQEAFFQVHRPFVDGAPWAELGLDTRLAATMETRTGSKVAFRHQSEAISHLLSSDGGHLAVTTGTGSGKTECFLLPVLQNALDDAARFRERPGLTAILVYPMNALANDQEQRIDEYLRASGHTYVRVERYDRTTSAAKREEIRRRPPHVLLTNYVMLEYLLVRPADREAIFANHRCRFLVLDEVHTYRGSLGANIALLFRRLVTHLGRAQHDDGPIDAADRRRFPKPQLVATSATIKSVDEGGRPPAEVAALRAEAVREFLGTLTGLPRADFMVLHEELRPVVTPDGARFTPEPATVAPPSPGDPAALRATLAALAGMPPETPVAVSSPRIRVLWMLQELLVRPMSIAGVAAAIRARVPERRDADPVAVEREVAAALAAGVQLGDSPGGLRVRVHRFIRGGWRFHRCVDPGCGRLYPKGESVCACRRATAPLLLCRWCGVDALHFEGASEPDHGALAPWPGVSDAASQWLLYRGWFDDEASDEDDEDGGVPPAKRGAANPRARGQTHKGSFDPATLEYSAEAGVYPVRVTLSPRRNVCPACGGSAGSGTMLTPVALGTSAAIRVLAEGVLESLGDQHRLAPPPKHDGKERLLIFADSRQDAAHQARFITYAGRYDRMRRRVVRILEERGPLSLELVLSELLDQAARGRDNPLLRGSTSRYLSPDVKARAVAWEEAPLLDDLAVSPAYRATLFNLGLVGVRYVNLRTGIEGEGDEAMGLLGLNPAQLEYLCRCLLDEMRMRRALSRDLLRYYPRHPRCPPAFEDAGWERRVTYPAGFACSEDGTPCATLASNDVPQGVTAYNLWRGAKAGGAPRVQKMFALLAGRMAGREIGQEDLLSVVRMLTKVRVLLPVELHGYSGSGRVLLQVNAGGVELDLPRDEDRMRCDRCNARMPWVAEGSPCRTCERGSLRRWDPAEVAQNRYVARIRRADELPLVAGEHTAQITAHDRIDLEADFKATPQVSPVNVLACSPTLEMGIDVGGLDAVVLRNVPPRPDNYAQRGGRAGRRGRVGVVLGYARNTPHDQYFYDHPAEMIAGEVVPPAIGLGNRDVVQRHLNALALGAAEPGLGGRMVEYLTFSGEPVREAIDALVAGFEGGIERAVSLAREAWGDEVLKAAGFADDDAVRRELRAQPARIRELFERVQRQVMELRRSLDAMSRQGAGLYPGINAYALIQRVLGMPREGRDGADADDRGEGYPMRRFAEFGILPGYEFPSEPATLRLLRDRNEAEAVSVARRFGLSQYQPGAPVNARGHRWRVSGLDMSSPWNPRSDAPTWLYRLCGDCHLRFDGDGPERCPRCSGSNVSAREIHAHEFAGFLAVRDDRPVLDEEERHSLAGLVSCHAQRDGHPTARYALASDIEAQVSHEETVRWLNESKPPRDADVGAQLHPNALGFFLCPSCGRMLTPRVVSPPTSKRARGKPRLRQSGEEDPDGHARSCTRRGTEPRPIALTTSMRATTLRLRVTVERGTSDEAYRRWALSLGYALRIGMRHLYMLDGAEIEFELEPLWKVTIEGRAHLEGALLFIDPAVGGSGFLERAAREIHQIAARSIEHLRHDACESACYRCLKSYQNQRFHELLSWTTAMPSLEALAAEVPRSMRVEIHNDDRQWIDAWAEGVDSPLELRFLREFEARGLAVVKQHVIRLRADEAPVTVADFAVPDRRIAIYIDSAAFHIGAQLRRDRSIRDRLREADVPWRVESLTVADLRAGLPTLADLWADAAPKSLDVC